MTVRGMNWQRSKASRWRDPFVSNLNKRAWSEYRAWSRTLSRRNRATLQVLDDQACGKPTFAHSRGNGDR
jgi:hypothetical protein